MDQHAASGARRGFRLADIVQDLAAEAVSADQLTIKPGSASLDTPTMTLSTLASPTEGGPSARERRKEEKKRQIIEAAIAVFLEHGFAGSSMDQIVAASKVSKRTMYNYYESKEDIFISSVEFLTQDMYKSIEVASRSVDNVVDRLRTIGINILTTLNMPVVISLTRTICFECSRFPRISGNFFFKTYELLLKQIVAELSNSELSLDDDSIYSAAENYLSLLMSIKYHRVVYNVSPPMNEHDIRLQTEAALDFFARAHNISGHLKS